MYIIIIKELKNQNIELQFTDNNKENIKGSRYFARGSATVIYKVILKENKPFSILLNILFLS